MPLTDDQLSSLPEFNEEEIEILHNGTSVRHRKVPLLVAYELKSDDVFMFTDKDGMWFVDYHHKGGPYKRRAL